MKISDILKEYINNSSIHGLRYLTQKGRSPIERFFWFVTVIIAVYGTYHLTNSSFEAYRNKAISFTVETDYLYWNTSFPTIALCETDNFYFDTVYEFVKQKYPDKEDDMEFQTFIYNVAFYSGHCEECERYCNEKQEMCKYNLKEIAKGVRTPCETFFHKCLWNGDRFNCCSKVKEVESEKGVCLHLNHINLNSIYPVMTSNKDTGPGILELELTRPSELIVLSPYDIPHHNLGPDPLLEIKRPSSCNIILNVLEIKNDKELYSEDIERRGCRFPDENPLTMFQYYSYSTCISECRAKYQMKTCNCSYHVLPTNPDNPQCGTQGLMCLYGHPELLILRGERSIMDKGILCPCIPSCVESEYKIIYKECDLYLYDTNMYYVTLRMASLPSERLKRNLIRNKLDLVIYVGSAAALFLGASLLSVVEIFMYCCIRPFIHKVLRKKLLKREESDMEGDLAAQRQKVAKLKEQVKEAVKEYRIAEEEVDEVSHLTVVEEEIERREEALADAEEQLERLKEEFNKEKARLRQMEKRLR